ncbi:hypothetical protein [Methanococcoides sp. AM1]|uniref:hypothetical protein n=1 Tax=Methanococcoides sp. AM1 TaxID=1201011 RepID=UPI001083E3CE|nr:hypothetical protein [Methanococcoides sp. AM1]
MIFVASAATTYEFQDPEGKYTFKLTFPDEDIVGFDPVCHVEGWGDYIKLSVDMTGENKQTGVDTKIEVEGVDAKEWMVIKRSYPIKRYYNSSDEFMLPYSSGCDQLQYCGVHALYAVKVSSKAPKGSATLRFTLVATDDETDDFFIVPAYQEIECGETIDFTLKKERNGIYSDVDDNEVEWIVGQSRSLSDFRSVTIGTIDNAGILKSNAGVFTSEEIGTCTVFAKIDGERKAQSEVVVKCPSDKEADLQEVIRLYQLRIPEGPYHRDLKAGKVWSSFIGMKPGTATNLYANLNDEYGEFTCGSYQDKVLRFLSKMQSTPGECHLLNGYDFGPIEGSYSAHHATVVYPKGTDWKKTGIVFDPWPQQKPEVMPIADWEKTFSPIAGDTSPGSRHKYNTTKDPNDYQYAAWTAAGDLAQGTGDLIGDMGALVGFGQCPVNILITDSNGRQLGAIDDSNMVFEIPDAFITRMADGEGGYSWYFILQNTDEYDVDITAFDDGEFEFFVMNTNTEQLQNYGERVIKNGEVAEVELSSQDPTTPMTLPDGSEVIPTLEEPVIPESTLPTEEKGLPGFELWMTAFVIFVVMLFRRS